MRAKSAAISAGERLSPRKRKAEESSDASIVPVRSWSRKLKTWGAGVKSPTLTAAAHR
jgi:hypothetical protein